MTTQHQPSLRNLRIENALLHMAGFFPWEDPYGDAWIHKDDEGYVMDRQQALDDALGRMGYGQEFDPAEMRRLGQ